MNKSSLHLTENKKPLIFQLLRRSVSNVSVISYLLFLVYFKGLFWDPFFLIYTSAIFLKKQNAWILLIILMTVHLSHSFPNFKKFCQHLNMNAIKCFNGSQIRSSHQGCSIKIGVLKNFSKFRGKHLCQSIFFNKVAGLQLY